MKSSKSTKDMEMSSLRNFKYKNFATGYSRNVMQKDQKDLAESLKNCLKTILAMREDEAKIDEYIEKTF